ncbi:membrane protein insertion efficiency factor YidD [Streptomyces sp. QHH-9511]|nr:membrane protein insertion efficiency factor YidD [Streptomyces sp. QHH-9511]
MRQAHRTRPCSATGPRSARPVDRAAPRTPGCSTYAVQALRRQGALGGEQPVLGRSPRCTPDAARRHQHPGPRPGPRERRRVSGPSR